MSDPVDDAALMDLWWSVAGRLRGASREQLAQRDITPAMSRALRTVLHHGCLRPGQLAEHLGITPRSSTEVVDALAERGLVQRTPDPDDRRATLIAATTAGKHLAKAIRGSRNGAASAMFGRLNADDRAELARLLALLRD